MSCFRYKSVKIANLVQEFVDQPRVFEDSEVPAFQEVLQLPQERTKPPVPSTQPIVAAVEVAKKKSCLSAPKPRKEPPSHPALRQKTVAFGKTVNVSQTVEVIKLKLFHGIIPLNYLSGNISEFKKSACFNNVCPKYDND